MPAVALPPRRSPAWTLACAAVRRSSSVGSRLVEALAEAGARVSAVVRDRSRAARIARCGAMLVEADLRRWDAEAVAGHDTVFSLAYDVRRPAAPNVAMHRALASACVRHG